jgi:arylsulfatase
VFAGFLSHTDHHIGRLLSFLKETGEFDNTLIMVVSDNGASAEGGPTGTTNELQFFNNAPESLEESLAKIDDLGGPATFNHYPWGWTWAGNTPFRRWKRKLTAAGPLPRSWCTGRGASGRVARCGPSTRTSSTWSPPSWTRSASGRPPRSGV